MTRRHFGGNNATATENWEGTLSIWLSSWSLVVLCLMLPTHSYTQDSSDDLPIPLHEPLRPSVCLPISYFSDNGAAWLVDALDFAFHGRARGKYRWLQVP